MNSQPPHASEGHHRAWWIQVLFFFLNQNLTISNHWWF